MLLRLGCASMASVSTHRTKRSPVRGGARPGARLAASDGETQAKVEDPLHAHAVVAQILIIYVRSRPKGQLKS